VAAHMGRDRQLPLVPVPEVHAIDSTGALFRRDSVGDSLFDFAWETAGQEGKATPVFPVTAWGLVLTWRGGLPAGPHTWSPAREQQ
jgi:hypothetical protein